jgi:hypothetical protein
MHLWIELLLGAWELGEGGRGDSRVLRAASWSVGGGGGAGVEPAR